MSPHHGINWENKLRNITFIDIIVYHFLSEIHTETHRFRYTIVTEASNIRQPLKMRSKQPNSCSDTHTPISDQDNNMTGGTVILRSPPKNSRIQLRKTKKSIGEVNSSAPHKQNLQATTPQTWSHPWLQLINLRQHFRYDHIKLLLIFTQRISWKIGPLSKGEMLGGAGWYIMGSPSSISSSMKFSLHSVLQKALSPLQLMKHRIPDINQQSEESHAY